MRNIRWNELLGEFKAATQIQALLPMVSDPAAQKLLLAWPNIGLSHAEPEHAPPQDKRGQWLWLWQDVSWDEGELADITSLQPGIVSMKFKQLQGNRLIFPDGSIPDLATKFMVAKMHEHVRSMKE